MTREEALAGLARAIEINDRLNELNETLLGRLREARDKIAELADRNLVLAESAHATAQTNVELSGRCVELAERNVALGEQLAVLGGIIYGDAPKPKPEPS